MHICPRLSPCRNSFRSHLVLDPYYPYRGTIQQPKHTVPHALAVVRSQTNPQTAQQTANQLHAPCSMLVNFQSAYREWAVAASICMYWFPTFKFSALILNHLVNSDSLNSLFYFFMHKVREVKAVNKNEKPDMKRLIKQSPYTVMLKVLKRRIPTTSHI